MHQTKQPRLRWDDIHWLLDSFEDDEHLENEAILTFPNTPNATAFIADIYVSVDNRIEARARFDVDTAPEHCYAVKGESASDALSVTPITWLRIREVLEGARYSRNFYGLARIGFPPDFTDESFCNYISKFTIGDVGTPVAVAFYDPE